MGLDEIRAEMVRMRGFIRASETQANKVIDLIDEEIMLHNPLDPNTRPLEPLLEPAILSISPNFGTDLGGTSVTINGRGFAANSTVTIGGAAATNVVVSADGETITCDSPAGIAGSVDVVVSIVGETLTSVDAFEYLDSGGGGGSPTDLVHVGHWDSVVASPPTKVDADLRDDTADTPWTDIFLSSSEVLYVVESTGLDFSTANCLEVRSMYNIGNDGLRARNLRYLTLPQLSNDGDELYLRIEARCVFPNPYPHDDDSQHNIEDPDNGAQNWSLTTDVGDTTWTLRLRAIGTAWPNNIFAYAGLLNHHTYTIEWMFHRLSSTTYNMHARIHNTVAGTLVADDNDFRNNNGAGSTTLADNPVLTFADIGNMDKIQVGTNGINIGQADATQDGEPMWYYANFSYRTENWVGV